MPASSPARAFDLGAGDVRALWTDRRSGDMRRIASGLSFPDEVPGDVVVRTLRQTHGSVVVSAAPFPASARGLVEPWSARGADPPEGDAVVAAGGRYCLTVLTADCASVALATPEGAFGAVHVGWRGLAAGVVERAVGALRAFGATAVVGGIGPCIHACCYRFEAPERDLLADRYGESVLGLTSTGEPALDLPQAVRRALETSDVTIEVDLDSCTACEGDSYSFRARRDEERQALLVWSTRSVP